MVVLFASSTRGTRAPPSSRQRVRRFSSRSSRPRDERRRPAPSPGQRWAFNVADLRGFLPASRPFPAAHRGRGRAAGSPAQQLPPAWSGPVVGRAYLRFPRLRPGPRLLVMTREPVGEADAMWAPSPRSRTRTLLVQGYDLRNPRPGDRQPVGGDVAWAVPPSTTTSPTAAPTPGGDDPRRRRGLARNRGRHGPMLAGRQRCDHTEP